MPSIDFVKDIQKKDRKTFFSDFEDFKKNQNIDFDDDSNGLPANSRPLIADFTEYSPLHNGHFHCCSLQLFRDYLKEVVGDCLIFYIGRQGQK